jgi:hypothetical protein
MRQFNYLWLAPGEICKRLGLAQTCFTSLTPEEQDRIPKLKGNIRADVALHLLRPEMSGELCEACLAPLKKTQSKYCSTICRNTHIAGNDDRTQRLNLELTNEFMTRLLEDSHQAEIPLKQFIKMAMEYGRHQVLLFRRTGTSQTHERLQGDLE